MMGIETRRIGEDRTDDSSLQKLDLHASNVITVIQKKFWLIT
jgi:hypothetical protein